MSFRCVSCGTDATHNCGHAGCGKPLCEWCIHVPGTASSHSTPLPAGVPTNGRDDLDRYYTPVEVAEACLTHMDILDDVTGEDPIALELGVGGGAWVAALRRLRPDISIIGVDIDPDAPGLGMCDDAAVIDVADEAALRRFLHGRYPDIVIGNPPFKLAEMFITTALGVSYRTGFLLRQAMLESTKRFDSWCDWPLRKTTTLAERVSFTGKGTDSAAYAMFQWDDNWQQQPHLDVLSWRQNRTAFSDRSST